MDACAEAAAGRIDDINNVSRTRDAARLLIPLISSS
jgi:hypothetical protein